MLLWKCCVADEMWAILQCVPAVWKAHWNPGLGFSSLVVTTVLGPEDGLSPEHCVWSTLMSPASLAGAEPWSAAGRLPCAPDGTKWTLSTSLSPGSLQYPILCIDVLISTDNIRGAATAILPAKGTFPPPLLLPNPRLYQLSIKKNRLQFGIRQNTLITKGWCNLITWYLFRIYLGVLHQE